MRVSNLIIITLLLASQLVAGRKEDEAAAARARVEMLNRIEALKSVYWRQHTEFRNKSAKRWKQQQLQLERKEDNKKSAEATRQQLELLYAEIAREKEEALSKQQTMESEKETLKEKREVWQYLTRQIKDKFDKTVKDNQEWFSLEKEERAREIALLQRLALGEASLLNDLELLFNMRCEWLKQSATIGVSRKTILLSRLAPITAQVLRVGHNFAYAKDTAGAVYTLAPTGQSGSSRFEWRQVSDPLLQQEISVKYAEWMQNRAIQSSMPVDVLQNEKSRSLAGKEETTLALAIKDFVRAGGPVLIPLGLILLWAFFLILERIFTYFFRHRRRSRLMKMVTQLLYEGKLAEAEKLVEKKSGLISGLVRITLAGRNKSRHNIEKAIEEYLLAEGPKLDKNLDTVSVLAGAAPLLGLLGTVTGMIRLFQVITEVGTGDPKMMAGGISEALITTECGLAIAIPLVLVHNWLRSRRNTLISDAEMIAMQMLNRLKPGDEPVAENSVQLALTEDGLKPGGNPPTGKGGDAGGKEPLQQGRGAVEKAQ